MLAFAPSFCYTPPVTKTLRRVLHEGSLSQVTIEILTDGECGDLTINGFLYILEPAELPTLESLQTLLRHERVETYLAVIDMLKEMAG